MEHHAVQYTSEIIPRQNDEWGEQGEAVLYGMFASPFSKRVEIALKMKGVEYEYFEEDLFSSKSEDLLKYNPIHKKVPVLVHNGKPIAESMVIIEYIDETWKSGPPILPADPYERAMARFWADFIPVKCMLPIWAANWSSDEEKSQKLAEEACENLRTLEKQLDTKKFFGGESVGYLDIAAIFLAHWLGILQEVTQKEIVKEDDFPLLSRWKEDFLDWSIAKESLPPKDKISAYFEDKAPIFRASYKSDAK